jgi:hypothetical protein
MERISDLRFLIGSFFTILGIILIVVAFTVVTSTAFGKELNLYSGAAMLAFGLLMLLLSTRK